MVEEENSLSKAYTISNEFELQQFALRARGNSMELLKYNPENPEKRVDVICAYLQYLGNALEFLYENAVTMAPKNTGDYLSDILEGINILDSRLLNE